MANKGDYQAVDAKDIESGGGGGGGGSYGSTGNGDKSALGPRGDKDWAFTNHGELGGLSRDHSVHVTDEVFNSASHLMAAMLSLLGMVVLVSQSSAQGAPWKIVSFSIYGLSLVGLFTCSFLHHSINSTPRVMEALRIADYCAIYPLISGSFTPMCLVFFHDSTVGWTFFGVVWALSIFGMVLTITQFQKVPKWMSMTIYVTLGWLGAFISIPLYTKVGFGGIALLAVGGAFYTIGGVAFTIEKPNPWPGKFGFHEIWHVFVIFGAATHWLLMFLYVLPWHQGTAVPGTR